MAGIFTLDGQLSRLTMLLFTKKEHADRLAAQTKTIELRVGRRYASLRAGSIVSINGRQRMRVVAVAELMTRGDVLYFVAAYHSALGFQSATDARRALRECYSGRARDRTFALFVRPIVTK